MKTVRFVSTGPVPPLVREILHPFGPVEIATTTDEDSLIQWMSGTIGLIVRGVTKVPARVIEAGTQLRVIGRSGIGCDNVDVRAATARGVPVVYTPGAGSRAVAEGAMALLLALAKRLPQLDASTKRGEWQSGLPARIDDLAGATIGIVGLGRIGKELAKMAHAFEMGVIAYDPYISKNEAALAGAGLVELDSLFARSDFICLHAPLTEATKGMVSRRRRAWSNRPRSSSIWPAEVCLRAWTSCTRLCRQRDSPAWAWTPSPASRLILLIRFFPIHACFALLM